MCFPPDVTPQRQPHPAPVVSSLAHSGEASMRCRTRYGCYFQSRLLGSGCIYSLSNVALASGCVSAGIVRVMVFCESIESIESIQPQPCSAVLLLPHSGCGKMSRCERKNSKMKYHNATIPGNRLKNMGRTIGFTRPYTYENFVG